MRERGREGTRENEREGVAQQRLAEPRGDSDRCMRGSAGGRWHGLAGGEKEGGERERKK